jgi:hypothetical protein
VPLARRSMPVAPPSIAACSRCVNAPGAFWGFSGAFSGAFSQPALCCRLLVGATGIPLPLARVSATGTLLPLARVQTEGGSGW